MGEISLRAELGIAEAEEALHRALTLATEFETRPLAAHCHLGLGKLYRGTGKPEQAQGHLTTAATMHREMGMRFWLEQASEEVRDLG